MYERTAETFRSSAVMALGAVALAALLWALAATIASRLFDSGVDPLELAAARVVIAAVGLGVLAGSRRRPATSGAPLTLFALGVSLGLVTASYYSAIERLPVAVAIVLQYTAPALVVAWGFAMSRRRPPAGIVAALVAALGGVTLVSGVLSGPLGGSEALGFAMGLASAGFFASYTLLGEKAAAIYGPIGAMFRAFVIAGALWTVYQSFQGWPSALFEPGNLPGVLFVGTGGTLVPFLLYVWAVTRVKSAQASITATLEPVLAAILAWVWLGQPLSAPQIAGGLCVLGAVVVLARRPAAAPLPVAATTDSRGRRDAGR